jgi:hypothetical protein
LYFAVRSERGSEPVLIRAQPVATARSAMVVPSVPPERCDMTAALEAKRGRGADWLAQAIEAELTHEERALPARSAALLERLATRWAPTRRLARRT